MREIIVELIFFMLLLLPRGPHGGVAGGIALTIMCQRQAYAEESAFILAIARMVVTHKQVYAAVDIQPAGAERVAQSGLPRLRTGAGHIHRFPGQTIVVPIVTIR